MKVVILAGGKGTRLLEETATIPKPMLMVGNKPLLHHIMDIYILQGYREFVIPVGYKQEAVFGYFFSQHPDNLYQIRHGIHFDFGVTKVDVVDTGEDTLTGGRLGRVKDLLHGPFHFTYGDGVGNVPVALLEQRHRDSRDIVTLTTVHPEGRFGRAIVDRLGRVTKFGEKVENETDWINGGFSVISGNITMGVDVNGGDFCNLEKDLYPQIAKHGYMGAVHHTGYWKCVDTLRDLQDLRQTYEKEGSKWLMWS